MRKLSKIRLHEGPERPGGHHQAQINRRLRTLGVEPPMVDYLAWVWLGRPTPEWGDAG